MDILSLKLMFIHRFFQMNSTQIFHPNPSLLVLQQNQTNVRYSEKENGALQHMKMVSRHCAFFVPVPAIFVDYVTL